MVNPPVVVVLGPEDVLGERAVAQAVREVRERDSGVDVITVDPLSYTPGDLVAHASPSLFGGTKVLIVDGLDQGTDELLTDVHSLLPLIGEGDVSLVVRHRGGARAKRLLDELRGMRARVIDVPAVKSDRDKSDFAMHEFRAAGRRASAAAVHALVEAVGKDLRELVASCQQLIADTTGTIDEAVVLTYYAGKVEATGFRVADAAVAGDASEALRLLRHAIAVGVDPVPIVAVLASTVRSLIKVGSAGRGRSTDLARELGMAPWQVDKARRLVTGWSAEGLAQCVQALAAADAEVKGGGRDPVYAVERAILAITAHRSMVVA